MAISFPGSNTSYDFANPQRYAIHLRLTPEIKEALLKAQQQGQQASLQLTGHAGDNALCVGSQSFALSAPIAQERLDVFQLSKQGCLQVGQIQQKTVVKRSSLQVTNKQHAQPVANQPQHSLPDPAAKHSKGLQKSGIHVPELQPVKPYTQHPKAHATHLNGRAQAPKAPVPHAEQPEAYSGLAAAHTARGPLQQPLQASLQQATSHEQQQRHGVMMSSAYPQTDPKHAQADPLQLQHPSQNAPPGSSLQSAQTALPQKPLKGKSVKAPAPAAGAMLSEEVLQQVCAAAKIGQKETLLIALLQCKPCKNQVLEAVLKEAEKRVPGFQRLQGESLKRACRSYGEMKPGNKWALQSQYLQQAQDILGKIQTPSPKGAAGSNQPNGEIKHGLPQPGIKRNRSEEPQQPQWQGGQSQEPSLGEEHRVKKKKQALEPEMGLGASVATDKVPAAKKKKRLRKAGELGRGSQSEESDRAAPTGLGHSRQTPTLEDSDSEDGYVPGSHRHTGHDRSLPTAAEGRPPPGVQQKGSSEHRWHPSLQNALTAYAQPRDVDAHRHNGHDRNASTSAQPNVPGYDRRGSDHGAGPSSHANGAVHTGFIRNGNLTGDLTGLNAQLDDRDPSGAGQDANGPEGEPALAVGKIKLKIRRPVSAASDTYDESWYSEHLDRQPDLQGDIQDLTEWELCLNRYDAKRATYFRLHQEIQDLKLKAIQEAPTEAEKASLQQQLGSFWDKRLHRSQQWDKAFSLLHEELQSMFTSLQRFYDLHIHSADI